MSYALSFRPPIVFVAPNLSKGAGTYASAGGLSTRLRPYQTEMAMELSLIATLAITALAMGIFGFASWRAKQPAQPLKVRMVNYHVIQFASIVVVLLMAAHLVTLFAGHPVTGQAGGYPY